MTNYGENPKQGQYWNEDSGTAWITYDAAMNERLEPITDILFQGLAHHGVEQALDIGCGAGATTRRMASLLNRGDRVMGLDISDSLLAAARAQAMADEADTAAIDYLQADAQSHDFEPQRFDLMLSRFGVMFFGEPVRAFANIRSAMRPGAPIRFVCWAPLEVNEFFLAPLQIALDITKFDFQWPGRDPGPLAFSDHDYVRSILRDAGFSAITIDRVETEVTTKDHPEANATFLMNMGMGFRAIELSKPDEQMREDIRQALIADGRAHKQGQSISYKAVVYAVTANA